MNHSKRIESVNGNKLTDVLTRLLAADFQRKTRLDAFENKRSKAKIWSATEVSKNVLSTLNSAKVRRGRRRSGRSRGEKFGRRRSRRREIRSSGRMVGKWRV